MVDTKCFRIHVVNEEIAQYEQFLLLPHVFVDVSYCLYNLKGPFNRRAKRGIRLKRVRVIEVSLNQY